MTIRIHNLQKETKVSSPYYTALSQKPFKKKAFTQQGREV